MDNQPTQPRRSLRRKAQPDRSDSPPPVPNKRRRISSKKGTPASRSSTASAASRVRNVNEPGQKSDANGKQGQAKDLQEQREVFRFMDLPAELRVHIYRMALLREEPLYLSLPQKQNVATDDEESISHVRSRAPVTATITLRHRVAARPRYNRQELNEEGIDPRPKDSINPALLRTCSLVYKEARQVLYSDNSFILNLDTGIHSLESLRQRNRSLIKSVALAIPSHHDILDGFADVVRLGLRYCWGLKSLTITLPLSFPDDRHLVGTTNVYANAFHILRWLPKGCKVKMEGSVSETIRKVVADEGRLMDVLDDKEYLKRQHQMPERH